MKNKVIILIVFFLCACRAIPEKVDEALELAGENRGDLKRVLWHYGWLEQDSLKFRAACFLIENMRWHDGNRRVIDRDPRLEEFCETLLPYRPVRNVPFYVPEISCIVGSVNL